jgi:hypothetical protein
MNIGCEESLFFRQHCAAGCTKTGQRRGAWTVLTGKAAIVASNAA